MYQNRRFFIRYLIGLLLFGFNGIVASHIALESSRSSCCGRCWAA